MRNDIAQLLCERPRFNRGETYRVHRRRANQNPEEASTKEGMSRLYRERKEFSEYFPPLLGVLKKNAGRPWDTVFSELNATFHGSGTVIDHARMHLLRDFVIQHPQWNSDGEPCYSAHSFRASFRDELIPLDDVCYVDREGILRFAPPAPPRKWRGYAPLFDRVPIDGESSYYKLDGIWFRVWTKPVGKAAGGEVIRDLLLKKTFHSVLHEPHQYRKGPTPQDTYYDWDHRIRDLQQAHGAFRYAYRKEAVNSRDIKRKRLNERLAEIKAR